MLARGEHLNKKDFYCEKKVNIYTQTGKLSIYYHYLKRSERNYFLTIMHAVKINLMLNMELMFKSY